MAVIAAITSYSHIYIVAKAAGASAVIAAIMPLSVDGLVLVGSLAMAAKRTDIWPKLAFILGLACSLAANVLAADSTWISATALKVGVFVFPPVALWIVGEVLTRGPVMATESIATEPSTIEDAPPVETPKLATAKPTLAIVPAIDEPTAKLKTPMAESEQEGRAAPMSAEARLAQAKAILAEDVQLNDGQLAAAMGVSVRSARRYRRQATDSALTADLMQVAAKAG